MLFLMLSSDYIRHILDRRHLTRALSLIITLSLPTVSRYSSLPPTLPQNLHTHTHTPLFFSSCLTNMQLMLFPCRSVEGACSSLQSLPLLYVMYVFTWSSNFLLAKNIPLIPATCKPRMRQNRTLLRAQ